MKSTVERKEISPEYPKLMISKASNLVVLFEGSSSGTVVSNGSSDKWAIGEYTSSWDMTGFAIFHGKVTLESE